MAITPLTVQSEKINILAAGAVYPLRLEANICQDYWQW